MKQLLANKNMNMDMSVSSNESVTGTETMKNELIEQIEGGKKETKNVFRIRFSIFGEV